MNVTITSAILMITSIIMASIFTAAALQQLYAFQNAFKDVSIRNEEMFSSSITIIGEARNASSPNNPIVIWVKNTGRTSFQLRNGTADGTLWDLFITFPSGTYERFNYSSTCSNDCWKAQILNDKGTIGLWEQGETLQITVYATSVPAGSYQVRLALPNGVTCEDKFSLG